MITKDKITSRINKLFSNLLFHFIFWFCAYSFYIFLLGDEHIFRTSGTLTIKESVYLLLIFISIVTTLLFTFIDLLFPDRIMRILPVRLMAFIKSVLYFLSAFLILFAAALPHINLGQIKTYNDLLKDLPEANVVLLRFLVYFYLSCFLNSFFRGFIKRMGSSNIGRWVFGLLNKPLEEERIFMFMDLKGSTTIAEKLGHKKFSHLVQDVFNDIAVVDNYYGEVYQYVGDEAIVSWSVKNGLKNNNFLKAFYAFTYVLEKRQRYYNRKYQLQPQFKAGIHIGKVMVLQVGAIRRDISYNGDTMNTAARIESKCNELKQQLLISADLYNLIQNKKEFRFKNVGTMELRGKKQPVEIYGVKQAPKL